MFDVDAMLIGFEVYQRSWMGEVGDIVDSVLTSGVAVVLGALMFPGETRLWVLGGLAAAGLVAIASRIAWGREESWLLPWVRFTSTSGATWLLLKLVEWLLA